MTYLVGYGFILNDNWYIIYNSGHVLLEYPMMHPPYAQNRAKELFSNYDIHKIKTLLENKSNNDDIRKKESNNEIINDLNEITNLFSNAYSYSNYYNICSFDDVFFYNNNDQNYYSNDDFIQNLALPDDYDIQQITIEKLLDSSFITKYCKQDYMLVFSSLTIINLNTMTLDFYRDLDGYYSALPLCYINKTISDKEFYIEYKKNFESKLTIPLNKITIDSIC